MRCRRIESKPSLGIFSPLWAAPERVHPAKTGSTGKKRAQERCSPQFLPGDSPVCPKPAPVRPTRTKCSLHSLKSPPQPGKPNVETPRSGVCPFAPLASPPRLGQSTVRMEVQQSDKRALYFWGVSLEFRARPYLFAKFPANSLSPLGR